MTEEQQIHYWQQRRWQRIRWFWKNLSADHNRNFKHEMISQTIQLIRVGKQQLLELKQQQLN